MLQIGVQTRVSSASVGKLAAVLLKAAATMPNDLNTHKRLVRKVQQIESRQNLQTREMKRFVQ